jgi:hypothetical protein
MVKINTYYDMYIPLFPLLFYLFILQYWGLNSEPTPWAPPQPFLVMGFFQHRVSGDICLSLLWTTILLMSASWVARITGMSHCHLAFSFKRSRNVLVKVSLAGVAACLLWGGGASLIWNHTESCNARYRWIWVIMHTVNQGKLIDV